MKKEVVKMLPKVELHCHLDGSICAKTIRKLAKMQGYPLPESEEELQNMLQAPKDCTSLAEYLKRFDVVLELLQTKEALEEVAYDLIEQAADENVQYIEIRYAPYLVTEKGLTPEESIEAVLKGLKRGEETFQVKSNLLLCGMRHHEEEKNTKIVELARAFKETSVVGFDLAGDEKSYPALNYKTVLKLAEEYHILITLHAGECGSVQNIIQSVQMGAKRIGHGIAMYDDEKVRALCKEKDILIEMCPTSNIQTKAVETWEKYPFAKFYKEGLKICINTDNRTVSGTTLTQEYMELYQHFKISYADMKQLNKNAIEGSFASDKIKESVLNKIEREYENYV